TLLDIIDHTKSPMGSRLLKRWLALPLKDVAAIEARLNVVEYATENRDMADGLHQHIEQVGDLERLISKAAVGRVTPREVVQLQRSLELLEPIKAQCAETGQAELVAVAEGLDLCPKMRERITREINPEAPAQLIKGNVMQAGVSEELDELRSLAYSGKDHLLQIQQRESDRTGIPSLKIGFNNVFGYYLEVTNAHKEKVPEEWIRKQTLVNAERYITEELKEYESKILGAEERIRDLEARLFQDLVLSLADFIVPVQRNAGLLAKLDCLLAFAHIAEKHRYTRPFINEAHTLEIEAGRHPVIEHQLPLGEEYVANDVSLDDQGQQVIMITGPNMSGKSALLRQTALIVLMAQMGSFVPAKAARIG
ncbi:MAG: DNA mismatch repair protein MutS, partial [Bacteroidota bacterium]